MDHFNYKNATLYAENVALTEIASHVPTPFYCYSKATIVRHYRVFESGFKNIDHQICYAVKANDNLSVLRILAQLGSGADAVSQGEIMRCIKAGIPTNKIVYSGVGKTKEELGFALRNDIMQINIESEAELYAISQVASGLNKEARIAFRINPNVDAKTHHKISTGRSHDKFGINYDEARAIYKLAASLPNIKVQGVAVHIGSQLTDLYPFRTAFTKIVELVKQLRLDGHKITHLDLGGGLGIPYTNVIPPSPEEYANMVIDVVSGLDCKLIFEPGRLIVGNSGILISKVIYTKSSATNHFIIIDAAMNNLIRPALYEAYHEIIPVIQNKSRDEINVDIVGPICETGDVFARDRKLPLMQSNELLAIRSSGAYGSVMGSTYNTRPLIAEVMVDEGSYKIIRKPQTLEELIARDL